MALGRFEQCHCTGHQAGGGGAGQAELSVRYVLCMAGGEQGIPALWGGDKDIFIILTTSDCTLSTKDSYVTSR